MTSPRLRALAALLSGAAGLAACQTVGLPPIVSLDGRTCTSVTTLEDAQAVTFNAESPPAVNLDAAARCVQADDGTKSAYAVFKLPEATEPYILGIRSVPLGQALVSPRITLLDAHGAVSRERTSESSMFHGASLYTSLRARPEERYLVVMSDPRTAGQVVSHIVSSTQAMVVPVGAAFMAIHSGAEANRVLVYAHSGTITVTARPLPAAN